MPRTTRRNASPAPRGAPAAAPAAAPARAPPAAAALAAAAAAAQDAELEDELPKCPITMATMSDPVVLVANGHTFERHAIETWLQTSTNDPLTNEPLRSRDRHLVPNYALRDQIDRHRAANGLPPLGPPAAPGAARRGPTARRRDRVHWRVLIYTTVCELPLVMCAELAARGLGHATGLGVAEHAGGLRLVYGLVQCCLGRESFAAFVLGVNVRAAFTLLPPLLCYAMRPGLFPGRVMAYTMDRVQRLSSQPIRVAAAVLFMSFVFLPQTANQIRQRQNRPGVDGLGMAEVFAIAGFYATLADLLVYSLGLTSCFALVAVMHLAGNGLVFERGFRDVFDL